MEFWNDVITDRAWKVLIELTKEFDVLVIGGWASYLLTKTLKSKDIDVVVDFETLDKINKKHMMKKNIHLKKYETIINEISVDIYVPYFSDLIIPLEELKNYSTVIEGIRTLKPEALLILKQQAELQRKDSVKGQKDRADILNILINSDIDLKKYFALTKKYKLEEYPKRLRTIIRESKKEFDYLGIKDPRKIKLIKTKLTDRIRSL